MLSILRQERTREEVKTPLNLRLSHRSFLQNLYRTSTKGYIISKRKLYMPWKKTKRRCKHKKYYKYVKQKYKKIKIILCILKHTIHFKIFL